MTLPQLIEAARAVREHAYVPSSRLQVGAAVLTKDSWCCTGCNFKNASSPLGHCAERTALFSALAHGVKLGDLAQAVVIGDTAAAMSLCGACRQVMLKRYEPDTPVLLTTLHGAQRAPTVGALLPFGCSGRDLQGT